jgi:hypothetical protein
MRQDGLGADQKRGSDDDQARGYYRVLFVTEISSYPSRRAASTEEQQKNLVRDLR